MIHATLTRIHNTGVLITGSPRSGKSELALSLLDRGHQLISDDAVELSVNNNTLIGKSPKRTNGFLSIYQLGVFNINSLLGEGALLPTHSIDLIIDLNIAASDQAPSLEPNLSQKTLLGIPIPMLTINQAQSRPLSVLIDIFVLQWQQQRCPKSALLEQIKQHYEKDPC